MIGDSLGVMVVLVLCGLVVPIAMVITAALIDVLALGWLAVAQLHDSLAPPVARLRSRAPRFLVNRAIWHR